MLSKLSLERAVLGLGLFFSSLPDSENIISQKEKQNQWEEKVNCQYLCVYCCGSCDFWGTVSSSTVFQKSKFHWNIWNEVSAYFILETKIAFDSKLKPINHPESKIASSLFVGGKRNLHLIGKIAGIWGCMSAGRRLGWHVFVCLSQIPVQSYCSAVFP